MLLLHLLLSARLSAVSAATISAVAAAEVCYRNELLSCASISVDQLCIRFSITLALVGITMLPSRGLLASPRLCAVLLFTVLCWCWLSPSLVPPSSSSSSHLGGVLLASAQPSQTSPRDRLAALHRQREAQKRIKQQERDDFIRRQQDEQERIHRERQSQHDSMMAEQQQQQHSDQQHNDQQQQYQQHQQQPDEQPSAPVDPISDVQQQSPASLQSIPEAGVESDAAVPSVSGLEGGAAASASTEQGGLQPTRDEPVQQQQEQASGSGSSGPSEMMQQAGQQYVHPQQQHQQQREQSREEAVQRHQAQDETEEGRQRQPEAPLQPSDTEQPYQQRQTDESDPAMRGVQRQGGSEARSDNTPHTESLGRPLEEEVVQYDDADSSQSEEQHTAAEHSNTLLEQQLHQQPQESDRELPVDNAAVTGADQAAALAFTEDVQHEQVPLQRQPQPTLQHAILAAAESAADELGMDVSIAINRSELSHATQEPAAHLRLPATATNRTQQHEPLHNTTSPPHPADTPHQQQQQQPSHLSLQQQPQQPPDSGADEDAAISNRDQLAEASPSLATASDSSNTVPLSPEPAVLAVVSRPSSPSHSVTSVVRSLLGRLSSSARSLGDSIGRIAHHTQSLHTQHAQPKDAADGGGRRQRSSAQPGDRQHQHQQLQQRAGEAMQSPPFSAQRAEERARSRFQPAQRQQQQQQQQQQQRGVHNSKNGIQHETDQQHTADATDSQSRHAKATAGDVENTNQHVNT